MNNTTIHRAASLAAPHQQEILNTPQKQHTPYTPQPPSSNTTREPANRPLTKFKAGAVIATIWANTAKPQSGTTGESVYHSISLDRRYMDKNGAWQSTSSLRVNDLPKAALVLQKAYEYLVLQGTSEPDALAMYGMAGSAIHLTEDVLVV